MLAPGKPRIALGFHWFGRIREGEKHNIKSLQYPSQMPVNAAAAVEWRKLVNVFDTTEKTFCPELPGPVSTLDDTPQDHYVAWLERADTTVRLTDPTDPAKNYLFPLPCPDRDHVMLPLSASKDELLAKMDKLKPWDQGTRIDQGLLWGWYNLSPKWRNRFNYRGVSGPERCWAGRIAQQTTQKIHRDVHRR
jgi:hypothetical protein